MAAEIGFEEGRIDEHGLVEGVRVAARQIVQEVAGIDLGELALLEEGDQEAYFEGCHVEVADILHFPPGPVSFNQLLSSDPLRHPVGLRTIRHQIKVIVHLRTQPEMRGSHWLSTISTSIETVSMNH